MLIIGDIIKKVKNSVSFSNIWLGGVEGVFSALCNKLKIMMMWVKLVIISKIVGINVNEVMNISVCIGSD